MLYIIIEYSDNRALCGMTLLLTCTYLTLKTAVLMKKFARCSDIMLKYYTFD